MVVRKSSLVDIFKTNNLSIRIMLATHHSCRQHLDYIWFHFVFINVEKRRAVAYLGFQKGGGYFISPLFYSIKQQTRFVTTNKVCFIIDIFIHIRGWPFHAWPATH